MSRSAKAKGRLGQQEVRDKLLETFPEFEKGDIKSAIMGDTGEDIQFSPQAKKRLPLAIEVKRRKGELKTVYSYMEQALNHSLNTGGEPVVFFRSDHRPWIVMIGEQHYMDLLRDWKINEKSI
tara:strand:- start:118 stop:486 length:369 start_codon:yes stop_codon:yes gene_type:complete